MKNYLTEVYLYEKLSGEKVRCKTCSHYCLVSPRKRGICGVRENRRGNFFALNYGRLAACHIDPIEKKPLFHFLPGTKSLSIATAGCNLRCENCQNWEISQGPKPDKEIVGEEISPKRVVEIAIQNNLPSISYTYTEPTIFLEYALDTMKLAKQAGLKNIWVSNGYTSPEAFELISPYLDAANVDLKSFAEEFYIQHCGAKLQPVLDTLRRIKSKKIWVEITTLVIPSLSDSKEMFEDIARFIKKELGPKTPWHISQFSGVISWKLRNLPKTPVETLKAAYEVGKKAGLKYVYTDNVPGLPSENTFCPRCETLVINRAGYSIERYDKSSYCPKCGEFLDLIL